MFRRRQKVPELRIVATDVRQGDTLVIECERRVPRDVFVKLKRQLDDRFPGVRVVLLEAGLTLSAVLREEDT